MRPYRTPAPRQPPPPQPKWLTGADFVSHATFLPLGLAIAQVLRMFATGVSGVRFMIIGISVSMTAVLVLVNRSFRISAERRALESSRPRVDCDLE